MFFKNKYTQSFAIAAYVGTVSALGTYFTALTQGLDWRQMLSIVGTSFIMPFAALSRALPDPLHQPPTVNVERTDSVTTTVNNPPTEPAAITPSQSPRTKTGRFDRRGTTVVVPPVDKVADF